ncbi:MAG: hypothetical protein ACLTNY_03980 [Blautia massiliensis (ex Durand et al. 2017)]
MTTAAIKRPTQHFGADRLGHAAEVAPTRGGRGRRLFQQAVLPQRSGQLAAHLPHMVGGLALGFLHGVTGRTGVPAAFLGVAQRVQLGLHLLDDLLRFVGLLRVGGVFAAAHQAADPGVILIFKTHRGPPRPQQHAAA